MHRITSLVFIVFSPIIVGMFYFKMMKLNLGLRLKERLGFLPKQDCDLWIHCASVGEVNAAANFIKTIFKHYPDTKITVSTLTCTGFFSLKQEFGDKLNHFFFCLDIGFIWRKVLKQLRPNHIIILEREIWPSLFVEAKNKNIPLSIINAKFSDKSLAKYQKFKWFLQPAMQRVYQYLAQSELDCQNLQQVNVPKCLVTGNLKFDINIKKSVFEEANVLKNKIGNRPVWIAGSTHSGEEKIILAAHKKILETFPDTLLIIAPRHPKRFEEVWDLCEPFTRSRFSDNETNVFKQVFLLDTMGCLLNYYGASNICFVAGSLNSKVGGHNLLEPAALKKAVLTGSNFSENKSTVDLLTKFEALVICSTVKEISEVVVDLLTDKSKLENLSIQSAKAVIANQGATESCMLEILKKPV